MGDISTDDENGGEGESALPPVSKQKAAWTPERREAMRQKRLADLVKAKEMGIFCAKHDPDKPKYIKEESRWTPEKVAAVKAARLENEAIAKRSSKWTPEMREAARIRAEAACAKAKDNMERQQRLLNKARYLKSTVTGRVFAWNSHLAQRKDMVEVANELLKNEAQDSDKHR